MDELEEKPYLKEGLTLKGLAEELNIPAHHLSIVVNKYTGKNFYGFINEYRIKNAKAMLGD
jgi:YesN/AraC family two-component response regulator